MSVTVWMTSNDLINKLCSLHNSKAYVRLKNFECNQFIFLPSRITINRQERESEEVKKTNLIKTMRKKIVLNDIYRWIAINFARPRTNNSLLCFKRNEWNTRTHHHIDLLWQMLGAEFFKHKYGCVGRWSNVIIRST